ncbi:MAG TPA: ribokinase [Kouleothrix sp.]|nr:ribokinase [Kouleothrix sp.]
MAVVVFGSINMDLVVRAPRLPVPGETLIGHEFFTAPGGKGANQAVACARLGATTRMIGRVGGDVFGSTLRNGLETDGIGTSGVIIAQETSSGVALIEVNDAAENTIVVVPGANGLVGDEDVARLDAALEGASALLLQLEVPLATVVQAAQRARARGVTVLLDPAPAQPLPAELYALADIMTPNETEAAILVGFPLDSPDALKRATEILLARGVGTALIKLGGRGAYWQNREAAEYSPPFRVQAIDTVAAGDAFNGGLATALDAGMPFAEAVRWGMAAGALATTKAGAQPALPTRAELISLLNTA